MRVGWEKYPGKHLLKITVLLILACIYVLQSQRLTGWIVDDAGISFSYARNLAAGYGLVSQPGQTPVEGFSNPLWVFLLSVFPLINLDIMTVVKPLSMGLSIAALTLMYFALRELGLCWGYAAAAVAGLVIQPAFIIWSVSGLENPLYAFLIAVLLLLLAQQTSKLRAAAAGVVCGLIAITRPEGILYSILYPLYHRKTLRQYIPGVLVIFAGYINFRLLYFRALFPNPYFKKSEQLLSHTWWVNTIAKSKSLLLGLFGSEGLVIAVITVLFAILVILLWKRAVNRPVMVLGAYVLVAVSGYLLLPKDWMGEYRYATPVFMLAYAWAAAALSLAMSTLRKKAYAQLIGLGFILFWSGSTWAINFKPRLDGFVRAPVISLSTVSASFERFKNYGRALGLEEDISILTPDVGGALYDYPEIKIYDLGGLVDPVMARTIGCDEIALRNYIFEELPDVIDLHGGWSYVAKLDEDERFRRLYVPIFEYVDMDLMEKYQVQMYSGDFVRKDLLHGPELLLTLQRLSPSWKASGQ